jgi:nucleoside-diphosphate-sugar epimerase
VVYDEALKSDPSIRYIIHTASPLNYSNGKTLADFVDPAVQGTLEILKATVRHGVNLQRVGITGNFAANGNPKDMQGNGKIYTSRDWNPVTAEEVNPENLRPAYWFSKTLAERSGEI